MTKSLVNPPPSDAEIASLRKATLTEVILRGKGIAAFYPILASIILIGTGAFKSHPGWSVAILLGLVALSCIRFSIRRTLHRIFDHSPFWAWRLNDSLVVVQVGLWAHLALGHPHLSESTPLATILLVMTVGLYMGGILSLGLAASSHTIFSVLMTGIVVGLVMQLNLLSPLAIELWAALGIGHALFMAHTMRRGFARLVLSQNRSEAGMKAKQDFLANMSHEVRTPLNGILGSVQMLENSTLTPAQRQDIAAVRQGAESLNLLLADIVDLARTDAIAPTDTTPRSLATVLNELARQHQARAAANGLTLKTEIGGEVPAWSHFDVESLRRTLTHLLDNALRFTDYGSVTLRVTGSAPTQFSVIDTGPGIAPAALEAVFEPFTQLDSSATRARGGSGLGLPLARKLVQEMGGELTLTSQLGDGTTLSFALDLPRISAPTSDAFPAQDKRMVRDQGMSPGIVLVVEDDALNARLLTRFLEMDGYEVHHATHGGQALDWLACHTEVDLILMDIQMPVMDGLAATRAIRQSLVAGHANVPIFAVTANALPAEEAACYHAGMNGFMTKPVHRKHLQTLIRDALHDASPAR